ncbi:MAG: metalloprotease PmbA, partial [Hydrogenophilaceae bacterium]|nr:metalloprotease PmbA [Hydrogenophilaceae bacterium]
MSASRFSYSPDTLRDLAGQVLALAQAAGATAAETEVSEGMGQTVSVRKNEVETVEYNKDKGIGVTVYLGQCRGHASTSDFSRDALARTVDKALAIARFTAEDDCAGLADAALLAKQVPDLDLYHPWDVSVEGSIEIARAAEAAAFGVDKRISNSEGASVSTQASQFVYANSLGFMGGYPTTRQTVSCVVIAEQDGAMQRDYWYTT